MGLKDVDIKIKYDSDIICSAILQEEDISIIEETTNNLSKILEKYLIIVHPKTFITNNQIRCKWQKF
ncbi:MAG: hypothetical protein LBT66_00155 [Methanobrevibacter sp.]|jgi:hypothetical protein|nr:hypothetical protein [Candidatus Methanovirga meridionalis]